MEHGGGTTSVETQETQIATLQALAVDGFVAAFLTGFVLTALSIPAGFLALESIEMVFVFASAGSYLISGVVFVIAIILKLKRVAIEG